mmetsp:Transcript_68233/g.188830  ORF Transcript_68233/g.188830 Transcript_68233/m.188830 type:complete len:228 (+) Transcript_68233:352-1035(+)
MYLGSPCTQQVLSSDMKYAVMEPAKGVALASCFCESPAKSVALRKKLDGMSTRSWCSAGAKGMCTLYVSAILPTPVMTQATHVPLLVLISMWSPTCAAAAIAVVALADGAVRLAAAFRGVASGVSNTWSVALRITVPGTPGSSTQPLPDRTLMLYVPGFVPLATMLHLDQRPSLLLTSNGGGGVVVRTAVRGAFGAAAIGAAPGGGRLGTGSVGRSQVTAARSFTGQ